jgi:hypothetical protein
MPKSLWILLVVAAAALFGSMTMAILPPAPKITAPPTSTPAVAVGTIDLSGKWESAESKAGTKMIAEIKNNTIHVEMKVADGFTGLWYGTFDTLQPGQNVMTSKAIHNSNYLVVSSAQTKDFLYQKESLIFDFSVMGTRTTVEMKRV